MCQEIFCLPQKLAAVKNVDVKNVNFLSFALNWVSSCLEW